MPCRSDEAPPLRVGIVNYLNSRPLAWSFLRSHAGSGFRPSFHSPSGVAERLATGRLDVGLIPSIEVQRIPGLCVVPHLCVAATREARSVLLLTRCAPERVRRIALDENSRTSAALVRILLHDRYGVDPHCISLPPRPREMLRLADAALVIGDPALKVERSQFRVLDLAAEWRQLTGWPFVFALWAVQSGVDLRGRSQEFERSLKLGLASVDELAQEAALELGLDVGELLRYLTEHLSYRLGAAELSGLHEFYRRAHALGIIPRPVPLRFV